MENGASLDDFVGEEGAVDNPADELELVSLNVGASVGADTGKFYGFPFCHTGFAPLPEPFDVVEPVRCLFLRFVWVLGLMDELSWCCCCCRATSSR